MRRKPERKRRSQKPKLDDELVELASVIAEHKLENNARGWFEVPWRSGWNAAWLAFAIGEVGHQAFREQTGYRFEPLSPQRDLQAVIRRREAVSYEALEEIRVLLAGTDRNSSTAARCLQLMVANSHGGGHVYNELLRPLILRSELPLRRFETIVRNARCADALGACDLKGQLATRRKRAFEIAWDRGLYHAAYAITSSTEPSR